jgi:hypothetical protein
MNLSSYTSLCGVGGDDQQEGLAREGRDIERRIARLVAAVEDGADAASLFDRIKILEARRDAIAAKAARLRPVPRLAPDAVEGRLAEWRRLLRQNVTQGRSVLQRVLRGRLVFTPREDGESYSFAAPTRFDRLFAGMAPPQRPPEFARGLEGTEHIRPEDTSDYDYGRLLEAAASAKCMATLEGSKPRDLRLITGPRAFLTVAERATLDCGGLRVLRPHKRDKRSFCVRR